MEEKAKKAAIKEINDLYEKNPMAAIAININTTFGKIDISSYKFYLGLSGNSKEKEKNKQKWLKKVYEQYGKHESIATDKAYRIGVQPHSGSPNFNPNNNINFHKSTDRIGVLK